MSDVLILLNIMIYSLLTNGEKNVYILHRRKSSNGNIVEQKRSIIETPNSHTRHRSLSWLGTSTSIKCRWVNLVLWPSFSSLVEIIRMHLKQCSAQTNSNHIIQIIKTWISNLVRTNLYSYSLMKRL